MPNTEQLSAQTLGQIALIQGMVSHLPDNETIMAFVCRGLEIVPGANKVAYRLWDRVGHESQLRGAAPPLGCLPLKFGGTVYGELLFNVYDNDLFGPYLPYLENLCLMLGVIFEERRQRRLIRAYQSELEHRVAERTRQLQQEVEEHKRSRKLLDSIINNTRNIIYVKDLDGRFTLVNVRFCEIFNLDRSRIIGRRPMELFPDDIARQHTEDDRLVAAQKQPITFNEHADLADGRHEYLSIKFPLLDDAGAVNAVGGISTDITEIKAAQKEMGELEKRLRQAYKMESIGTLAGGIAHDFNNILSAIFGYTELSLSECEPGTFVYSNLKGIMDAATRAKDLVGHILTFSRQSEHELIPVEMLPIVREVVKFMRASLPASIEIRQTLKGAPMVMADPTLIHQVVMNLCTNAGHAMAGSGGVLGIELQSVELDAEFSSTHPGLTPGTHIHLTVSDTGHGIAPELIERVFDPFFTTKKRGEGTGMGLSVVHGIVKSLGGTITVHSRLGEGSSFKVFIPAIERRTVQSQRPEMAVVGGSERVLFVDDEGPLVQLGIILLGSLGYKVTGVSSSTEALALFKTAPDQFDLVITDQTMPKLSGDQLARQCMEIRPGIPVILCTGFSATLDEASAKTMGIRAFINKPILKRQIAKAIREVLDNDTSEG